jgi:succinyl-CoA synthetase alpha subunit
VFIDNLYKTIGTDKAAGEEFVAWCAKFAADNNMEITISISEDPANASDIVKQYL